jgi:hypothetical protein
MDEGLAASHARLTDHRQAIYSDLGLNCRRHKVNRRNDGYVALLLVSRKLNGVAALTVNSFYCRVQCVSVTIPLKDLTGAHVLHLVHE